MQASKGRNGSSEVPQKVSPRGNRSLRPPGLDTRSLSPTRQGRTPVDRSPKVPDKRSPRSPATERKRPSRLNELENQISLLQDELRSTKARVLLSESAKKQALDDAEESKKQVAALMLKLEEFQKKEEDDEGSTKMSHVGVDTSEFCSALIEIELLKAQVKSMSDSEAVEKKQKESIAAELQALKGKMADTLSSVEDMKIQLRESKEAELKAQSMASSALSQLETAKEALSTLMLDGQKGRASMEGELEEEVDKMKDIVKGLKADLIEKETELEEVLEENKELRSKLENMSCPNIEMEEELVKMQELAARLNNTLVGRDSELQKLQDSNQMLQTEISKKMEEEDRLMMELDKARAGEREAKSKLEVAAEEAERSVKKIGRVTEQLDAAQATNSEMETELRRLKVQSDQWRKAAEAAATMLSGNNNGKMDRSASQDGHYSPVGKTFSPFNDDADEDNLRKNGSVLRKIGLWKKPKN